jgi:hypothetical protein
MASGKKGASVPPARKRPAPTIDLKATEITSEPVTPSQPIDPPADTAQAEVQPPEPQPTAEPRPAAFDRPEPAPEPTAAAAGERFADIRAAVAARRTGPLLGAGAIGAGVTLCMLLVLWAFGAFGGRDDATAALAARLANLEQQVRDLAGRPQPAGLDQRALAELAARVGAAEQAMGRLTGIEAGLSKLETTVATPRPAASDPALGARVAALETALRPLADLGSRVDAIDAAQKNAVPPPAAADQGEVTALAARVAALEQAEKAIEQRVARAPAGGADQPGRIAFVAVALRAAAERGDPFAQELVAAKALAPDAALLAPLEPYVATGVPRPAMLARELSQIAGPMLNAAAPARESGIIDRLQQNAERLVRIRPISEAAGDEPTTIVARAEVKATHGDIAGALGEIARLPDAARAPAQGWMRKAEMQVAALAAARRFAESAVNALAKAAP